MSAPSSAASACASASASASASIGSIDSASVSASGSTSGSGSGSDSDSDSDSAGHSAWNAQPLSAWTHAQLRARFLAVANAHDALLCAQATQSALACIDRRRLVGADLGRLYERVRFRNGADLRAAVAEWLPAGFSRASQIEVFFSLSLSLSLSSRMCLCQIFLFSPRVSTFEYFVFRAFILYLYVVG